MGLPEALGCLSHPHPSCSGVPHPIWQVGVVPRGRCRPAWTGLRLTNQLPILPQPRAQAILPLPTHAWR